MSHTPDALNRQFGLPGLLAFEQGEGGLIRAAITTPGAQAHVYLHGAHIASFVQADRAPLLFLSGQSAFATGKPIRGGVPVIFPWFGAFPDRTDLPMHGFARLREWSVESVARLPQAGLSLTLLLRDDAQTLALWPHRFELRFRVSILPAGAPDAPARLRMELLTRNTDDHAWSFEEALHTYFHVGDVRQARVEGLDGVTYNARNEGSAARVQAGPVLFTGETDRLYQKTDATCVLHDPAIGRQITVEKVGSLSTVVWNPWIDRAKAIPDLGDDEWPGMLCIETANAREQALTLAPGQTHAMVATLG